ncbi:MAG TPA: hypothetical protein VMZ53_27580 [Kofleriaceae bacterium]|nr:hypothetical protein [Kofleriaceae bacterium]
MRSLEFAGHAAVELAAGPARMVVVHDVGPRIAWFGLVGRENLLYWDTAGAHREGAWRLYGGHRLWVTRPLADESAEIHEPDNAPCVVEELEDGVRIRAPRTTLGLEKTLEVRVRGAEWSVRHHLRNSSGLLWSGGAWALTCTLPSAETVYRIPLGGGPPTWDIATIIVPLSWGTHTSRLDDPQISFNGRVMEVRAQSDESKRMVRAPLGTIEMHDAARGLFRKVSPFDQNGAYPLDANLALYVGPQRFMVEMESMSALRTLAPGMTLEHVEVWTIESL